MEKNDKRKRCCFTGHRPDKQTTSEDKIASGTIIAISNLIDEGYITFITGMAPGFDIIAAEIVLQFKTNHPEIELICAIPYRGFENRKDPIWHDRILNVFNSADLTRYISESYSKPCFQKRNVWMVDHSSMVLTDYNGTVGGTRNTINYANSKNISVINVKDFF